MIDRRKFENGLSRLGFTRIESDRKSKRRTYILEKAEIAGRKNYKTVVVTDDESYRIVHWTGWRSRYERGCKWEGTHNLNTTLAVFKQFFKIYWL